jgi:pimeloyl-ACP methyl ester carboxylesterase
MLRPNKTTSRTFHPQSCVWVAVGSLRTGFELYRAFPADEQRFKQFMRERLSIPVLALAGEKSNGSTETEMARAVAENVRGGVAPKTGHWLPDENPDFVSKQLVTFLRESEGAEH